MSHLHLFAQPFVLWRSNGDKAHIALLDWSFEQLCRHARLEYILKRTFRSHLLVEAHVDPGLAGRLFKICICRRRSDLIHVEDHELIVRTLDHFGRSHRRQRPRGAVAKIGLRIFILGAPSNAPPFERVGVSRFALGDLRKVATGVDFGKKLICFRLCSGCCGGARQSRRWIVCNVNRDAAEEAQFGESGLLTPLGVDCSLISHHATLFGKLSN